MLERQKLRVIVQLLFFVFILRTNGNQKPAWGSYKHSEIVLLILQYAVKIIIALSIFHWFLKELLTYYLKEPPYNWLKMKCRFEISAETISINVVKSTLLFKKKARKMRSSVSYVCHLELHSCKLDARLPMNHIPFHDCFLLELSMHRLLFHRFIWGFKIYAVCTLEQTVTCLPNTELW